MSEKEGKKAYALTHALCDVDGDISVSAIGVYGDIEAAKRRMMDEIEDGGDGVEIQ